VASKGRAGKRASGDKKPASKGAHLKGREPSERRIDVVYHPAVRAEIADLPDETQANVLAQIAALNGKTHQQLVKLLDERSERKVCQWESSDACGTLRIVFAWGRGKLWAIGAFVKNNDAQGERFVRRILHRVAEVQ
jgi:hypothetical protein